MSERCYPALPISEAPWTTQNGEILRSLGIKTFNIAVVDDDLAINNQLGFMLNLLGCEVFAGTDAHWLAKCCVEKSLGLIILDWMLPTCSGGTLLFETERIVRGQWAPWESDFVIPVIVNSSLPIEHIEFPESRLFKCIGHWSKVNSKTNRMHRLVNAIIIANELKKSLIERRTDK